MPCNINNTFTTPYTTPLGLMILFPLRDLRFNKIPVFYGAALPRHKKLGNLFPCKSIRIDDAIAKLVATALNPPSPRKTTEINRPLFHHKFTMQRQILS
jgi:hypothetical protein